MLFNSWGYFLFLVVAVIVYWSLRPQYRIHHLCLCSLLFYGMWRWEYTFLLIFSASVDFVAARKIATTDRVKIRKAWLLASLSINLGLLVYFKYTMFLVDNIVALASGFGSESLISPSVSLAIILPLGISFYTFQTISYSIDVYRGVLKPANDFVAFLTYVIFWPQLVAGPILRANEVLPQLLAPKHFKTTNIHQGVGEILVGLFKKCVLADGIAPFVDAMFSLEPSVMTGIDVWVAAFLFGFQIYFDFSGYSQIAIGSARLLGIDFPKNFNWPYLATTPKAFWSRWHISLSSWIRDYLYLPLTRQRFRTNSEGGLGNQVDETKTSHRNMALIVTWGLMGLWHGASWNFFFWGIYHAFFIMAFRLVKPLQSVSDKVPFLGWALTIFVAMGGWVFFRAPSLNHAFSMYGKMVSLDQYRISPAISGLSNPTIGWSYLLAAVVLVLMVLAYFLDSWKARIVSYRSLGFPVQVFGYAGMVFLVLLMLKENKQFIYFQF